MRTFSDRSIPDNFSTIVSRIGHNPAIPTRTAASLTGDTAISTPRKEFSYTINLQGTKETKFTRESVLSFLLGIEVERLFPRTKRISLEFSDNDIAKMEAIVCHFKREKPAAPKPN